MILDRIFWNELRKQLVVPVGAIGGILLIVWLMVLADKHFGPLGGIALTAVLMLLACAVIADNKAKLIRKVTGSGTDHR